MSDEEHWKPTRDTYATVLFGLSTMALGGWMGSEMTGRYIASVWRAEHGVGLRVAEHPEWVSTIETVRYVPLTVFAVCILGVLWLDYRSAGSGTERS